MHTWQALRAADNPQRPALARQGGPGASRPVAVPGVARSFWACALLAALWTVGVALWRAADPDPASLGDFYPLYYGARAWLDGGDAHALATVAHVTERSAQLLRVGNAYPLPATLLVLPLALLPPAVALVAWLGGLVAALVAAARLARAPGWLLLYLPLLDGLRLAQYTALLLALQLVALWALRERRPWLLAACGALILTKPTHGLLFVLALTLLARNWRRQAVALAAVWGGALLLDPGWVAAWIPALHRYMDTAIRPVYWPLALGAVPLLLRRDLVGGAVVLQAALLPWSFAAYPLAAVPLGALGDARARWLLPASYAWPLLALLGLGEPEGSAVAQAWATALTLLLPVAALALLHWWERAGPAPVSATGTPPRGAGRARLAALASRSMVLAAPLSRARRAAVAGEEVAGGASP